MLSLRRIVTRLLMPLLGFNLAGLAAAALMLVSKGQAQVIWLGFIMLAFSPFIIPILLIPAGIFSHFMTVYAAAGKAGRERLMFILSLGYIILFLTFWCTGVFNYVTHSVAPQALRDGVLWAGAAALAPLLWWSSRDAGNIFVMMMVEMAQVAMIALSTARLLGGESPFWVSFSAFGGFLVLVAAGQSLYEKKFMSQVGTAPD